MLFFFYDRLKRNDGRLILSDGGFHTPTSPETCGSDGGLWRLTGVMGVYGDLRERWGFMEIYGSVAIRGQSKLINKVYHLIIWLYAKLVV